MNVKNTNHINPKRARLNKKLVKKLVSTKTPQTVSDMEKFNELSTIPNVNVNVNTTAKNSPAGFTGTVNGGSGRGRKPFSDDEIAADIRYVSIKLGYTDKDGNHLKFRTLKNGEEVEVKMSTKEYTQHGVFSAIMISKRFRSFSDFRDVETHKKGNTRPTKRVMLKELNKVLRILKVGYDYKFTPTQFNEHSAIPWQAYVSRFGNWEAVREAAMSNDWDATIR